MAWPAHLFCQQVALGWVCDVFSGTVSGSHGKLHIRGRWKRLRRMKENAYEATRLHQGRRGWREGARALGLRIPGSAVSLEHTEWPGNSAPAAATGQLLGHCALKCLYTELKEVKDPRPTLPSRDESRAPTLTDLSGNPGPHPPLAFPLFFFFKFFCCCC